MGGGVNTVQGGHSFTLLLTLATVISLSLDAVLLFLVVVQDGDFGPCSTSNGGGDFQLTFVIGNVGEVKGMNELPVGVKLQVQPLCFPNALSAVSWGSRWPAHGFPRLGV